MDILPDLEDFIEDSALESIYEGFISSIVGRNPTIEPKPRQTDIIRAINKKKYVGFYYDDVSEDGDVKPGFRLVEPYVFGHGFKNGSEISHPTRGYLRGFVVKSSKVDRNENLGVINRKSISKSERRPYWRLFRFDRIQTFQMLSLTIPAARYRYNPDDKMIGNIVASGQYSSKRIKKRK